MADEQAHINKQLFELATLALGMVNDLALQVAVLRRLSEDAGTSPETFDALVTAARAQVMDETTGPSATRVQRLVDALKLDRQ